MLDSSITPQSQSNMDDGGGFPLAEEIPYIDGIVDAAAGCDVITPAVFLSRPGVALEFTTPPGRAAYDVVRHLRQHGIDLPRMMPIMSMGADTFVLKVPSTQADRATALLRRMR